MAVVKPLPEGWDEWLAARPQVIKDMAARWPPDRLYRLASGHRVTIQSYNESGTVTVAVTGQYNRVIFGREVFGIPISELRECDPPLPGEDVGDFAAELGLDVDRDIIPAIRREMGKPGGGFPPPRKGG